MDATAPIASVVVELLNDDVFTFSPEDMAHIRVGGVLGYEPGGELDDVVDALRDPDGWVEFGGATARRGENDWDDFGPALYSRTTIFARHVTGLVVVYDEPARMDLPEEWGA